MSRPLPSEYRWLLGVEGRPRMIDRALELYGILEGANEADNPVILGWAREVGLPEYRHDSTAWCGLFVALVAKRAGKPIPEAPLWALSWAKFGVPSPEPALGDVLTFRREGGGHVGLYVAEDVVAYHVLGGNQGDSVSVTRIRRERLYKARRPAYKIQPAGVRPYSVSAKGALSVNEA